VVYLVGGADFGNAVEGEVEDADLDEAGEGGGDDLGHKHCAWGDLYLH